MRRPRKTSRRHRRREERKRKRSRRDGCSGKKRYDDLDVAKQACVEIMADGRAKQMGIYPCDHGVHWHVTSKPGDDCLVVLEFER